MAVKRGAMFREVSQFGARQTAFLVSGGNGGASHARPLESVVILLAAV